jgi:hypothetical protein
MTSIGLLGPGLFILFFPIAEGREKMSKSFVLNRPSLSISRYMSRYEEDLVVSVISFISAQWDRGDQGNHQT